ncbi:MAG: hypothetical protein ACT4P1_09390 [Sporichthyaceae bacterium]
MSASLRAVVIAAAVLATTGLSACGAGFTAGTDKVEAGNANGEVGGVLARNLVLVKSPQASPAALAGTLINNGNRPDLLERIELTENTAGARTISLTPALTLAPGAVLPFGSQDEPPLTIPEAASLRVGNFATVVLRFRDAGDLSLSVPIEPRDNEFAEIVPEAPKPTVPARPAQSPDPEDTAPAVKP